MSDEKKYADWSFTGEDFALRLKHFREERGYTQAQLAALMGNKTAAAVSRFESGNRKPTYGTILKYAAALGIDVEDLIYGNEQSAQQAHEINMSDDVISRQAAVDEVRERIFQEIVVEYPPYNFPGKPYFSIKYMECGQEFIGFGTYKPEVLSEYLKEYFMPSVQPGRKKGKWITEYLDGIPGRRAKITYCSECGQVSPYRHKFCHECGADMRGNEDG